ncbi:CoA-binding protein [archaeon]|nr:CoA-binding protein [archaeon]
MDKFFNAKNVAIVGVSRDINKIGHVIFQNFIESDFKGNVYAVNPNVEEVLGYKTFSSVNDIDEVDLVVIAVPADLVLDVVKDCGKKKVRNVVIISSGFAEVGNEKLEKELKKLLDKYDIKAVGPNCLGLYDSYSEVDTIFMPKSRVKRPEKGKVSFVSQSGAVGGAILDLMSDNGFGFSKFISYGNGVNLDISDFLEYLKDDENTDVICFYLEGVKDGERFFEVLKEVSKVKPVIGIKAGVSEEGREAIVSHTGSLSGDDLIYDGIFKQCGVVRANSVEELFDFVKIFLNYRMKGKKIQVITNGGGYGIMCVDSIIKNELELSEMSGESKRFLRSRFSKIIVGNPIDLLGDGNNEMFKVSIEKSLEDKDVDGVLVVLLLQLPMINSDIIDDLVELKDKKPIVVVSTGGSFSKVLIRKLEDKGIPVYVFPENAVRSLKALSGY